jgi:hypothetical protein
MVSRVIGAFEDDVTSSQHFFELGILRTGIKTLMIVLQHVMINGRAMENVV